MLCHERILFGPALGAGLAMGRPIVRLQAAEALDRDFGMEVEPMGPVAIAKGLIGKKRTRGQMHRALGNGKGVKMRLAHVLGFGQEIAALTVGEIG